MIPTCTAGCGQTDKEVEIIDRVLEAQRSREIPGGLGKDLDISGRPGNKIFQKSSKQEEANSVSHRGA